MSLSPRITLDEEYLSGLKCAICNNPNLKIVHVEKYPDFVSCSQCGSAFVVENGGSWVMYGKIPPEYPQTSQFALKQWTWLDAVAQRAVDEREMSPGHTFIAETSPPFIEKIHQEPTIDSPPLIEKVPTTETEEGQPTLSDETPAIVEKAGAEIAQKPPLTEDVIFLGDETEASTFEEPTPSFREADPTSEDVIVPSPFKPIESPEISEIEEPFSMLADEAQPNGETFIQDVTDKVLDESPDILALPSEWMLDERPESISHPSASAQGEFEPTPPDSKVEKPDSPPPEDRKKSLSVPVGEPEPDKRFQITIQGSQPKYPKNYCAHCLRTPVKLKAIMRGSLPDPKQPGKRKWVPLDLPFCKDCQKRMEARSQDENNGRLMAFLVSSLFALFAIIAPLLLGFVDFGTNLLPSIILLLVSGTLGFSIPLLILLARANKFPPPRDTAFVLSTLLVHEAGEELTQFEWRNHGYAELFRQVNITNVMGNLEVVKDRIAFTEIQAVEVPKKSEKQTKQGTSDEPIEEEIASP